MSFSDLQPVSPASGCRSFLGSHGKALAPLAGCRRCDRVPPDGPFRLWEEPVREAVAPVVTVASEQPDANRIAARHDPIAVVLDLVNPVGSVWETVSG
jgi:hypothetical protein